MEEKKVTQTKRFIVHKKTDKDGSNYFRVHDTKYDYYFDTSVHSVNKPTPYFLTHDIKLSFRKCLTCITLFQFYIESPNCGTIYRNILDISTDIMKMNEFGFRISLRHFYCNYTLISRKEAIRCHKINSELCVNDPSKIEDSILIKIKELKGLTKDFDGHFGSCELRFIPINKFKSHIQKMYNRYADLLSTL